MKKVKIIPAMFIAICILLGSVNVAFAAADCNCISEILADYTNGSLPIASNYDTGTFPAKTLTVVDTTAVDSSATVGDKALWFANTDGNGVIQTGRGNENLTLTNDLTVNKHIKFDFYVPSAAFFGTLRAAKPKYGLNYLNSQMEFASAIEFNSAFKTDRYLTQLNFQGGSLSYVDSIQLPNEQWHRVDMFIGADSTEFYVDGNYICTTKYTDTEKGVLGFQLLPGSNGQIYNDKNAGVYFDNIKVKKYNTADVKFCGNVIQTGRIVKAYFTEPVKSGQSLENVMLRNTKTGEAVTGTTVTLNDDVMTITLPATNTLERGTEYVIEFPEGFKSIRNKTLYSNIYFNANSHHPSNVVDFDDYTADSETVTNNVITSLTSSAGSTYRNNNIQIAVPAWMNAGLAGVKDFSNMYSDHGNVMALRYNAASGRGYNEVRCGVTILAGLEDLSQNSAAVEFDMMIPQRENLEYLYFGPYSQAGGINASGGEVNHGGLTGNGFGTANTQYAHIIAPDRYNTKFNSRKDGTIEHSGSTTDSNANYDHSAAYTNGEWCKVKITIKKTGTNAYETKFYLNNELVSTVTGMNQADRTDTLRGVRFTYMPKNTVTNITNLAYFDNFKISKSPDRPMVSKARIYNRDGEEFGMLSNKVKASAPRADIYLNGNVDTKGTVVTLTGGDETISSTVSFDSAANKLAVEFNKLLKTSTQYTLSVTGLKDSEGASIAAYNATFTTSDEGEFEVTLELTDSDGNVITDKSGLKADDVIYIRSSVINTTNEAKPVCYIAATYNSESLSDAEVKSITVPSGTSLLIDKDSENAVFATVESIDELEIGGFAWDSLDNLKPYVDAVKK